MRNDDLDRLADFVDMLDIEAELAEINAQPLTEEQLERMVSAAVVGRFCDGCGEERPYGDGRGWSVEGIENYCPPCTRRRMSGLGDLPG